MCWQIEVLMRQIQTFQGNIQSYFSFVSQMASLRYIWLTRELHNERKNDISKCGTRTHRHLHMYNPPKNCNENKPRAFLSSSAFLSLSSVRLSLHSLHHMLQFPWEQIQTNTHTRLTSLVYYAKFFQTSPELTATVVTSGKSQYLSWQIWQTF